jgi:hypothetical protein
LTPHSGTSLYGGFLNAPEEMKKTRVLGTILIATAVTVMSAPAQANQRQENQQDRITQGVKSGQLTAGETAKLETKEAAINQEGGHRPQP